MPFANAYRGQRVLVTGHTGFKGAWLTEWLLDLGAEVTGVALAPPTEPALFDQLGFSSRINDHRSDIRDLDALKRIVAEVRPSFVFHLAAQPLVRLSYKEPLRTYTTNIIGTANLLDAIREFAGSRTARGKTEGPVGAAAAPIAVVAVTTDKVYLNTGSTTGYREDDKLGGNDPYSSSKAAAEMVVHGYQKSYFSSSGSPVRLASARAGNVVGGGDWALDRIVPDCIRSLQRGFPIPVRNQSATRPWQHVLEPLSGYLWLAASLAGAAPQAQGPMRPSLATAFNFGPEPTSNRTVRDCVETLLKHWPGRWEDKSDPQALHEAHFLSLDIEKAGRELAWKPVWDFERTMGETASWYKAAHAEPSSVTLLTRSQIAAYQADAAKIGLAWAK